MVKHKIGLALIMLLLALIGPVAAQDDDNLLQYGDFIRAELSSDGGINVWQFEGTAGDLVIVDLQSDDFDPVLEIFFDDELIYSDDDGGLYSNAYLETDPLPADGSYLIFVKGAFESDGGEYYLSLRGGQPILPADGLTINSSIPALLSADENDRWRLTVEEDTTFSIAVRSPSHDLFVAVLDAAGNRVAEDDDSGGDLNPLIPSLALAAGDYEIEVSPAVSIAGDGAAYVLEVWTTVTGSPIEIDSIVRGVLLDARDLAVWEFVAEGGESISVYARSEFFDTVLTIFGPNGEEIAFDDDSGASYRSSYIALTLSEAGTYQFAVGTFGSGTGLYELRVLAD